jgi:hypothetical protein
MLKKIMYLLFILSLPVMAQKEAANWYFGFQAGLDFNSGIPVPLTNGQLTQLEGCATISDRNGNLLFYTGGESIYNANHVLMQNGTGLLGSQSSSQSAIIIPVPTLSGDSSKYYVFTVDDLGETNGLRYSVVDMTLDGGLGGVDPTQKNIQLLTKASEKITAVRHTNNRDVWVIAHKGQSKDFVAYLITSDGIINAATPVVSTVGEIHYVFGFGQGTIGYLKASPDGKKLASAKIIENPALEVFDFNATLGSVTNQINIWCRIFARQ